jgi:hypothetical protein
MAPVRKVFALSTSPLGLTLPRAALAPGLAPSYGAHRQVCEPRRSTKMSRLRTISGTGFGFGCSGHRVPHVCKRDNPTDTCNMLPRRSLTQRRVWSHLCVLFYSFQVYKGPLRPPVSARLRPALRPRAPQRGASAAAGATLNANYCTYRPRCTCVAPCTGPVAGLERARGRRSGPMK